MSNSVINVGVNAIIEKDGKVLMGKRINTYGSGTWGFPGGHLEYGESLRDGIRRELMEETGLTVDELEFLSIIDQAGESSDGHYIQINFRILKFHGVLEIKEPDECEEWRWFDIHELPEAIFPPHKEFIPALLEEKFWLD